MMCAAVAPLIPEQQRQIDNLISNLCTFLQMKTDNEIDLADRTPNDFVQEHGWCVLIDDVATHSCKDQGLWSHDILLKLPNHEQQAALRDITQFSIHLVARLSEVQAEHNSNNEICELESPPVMPADLIAMRTSKFVKEILDSHREHISQFWHINEIDMIEKDHQARDVFRIQFRGWIQRKDCPSGP